MANLSPTVQTSGNAHWNRMQDQVGNSAMSMGGGAVRANNYLVDGFPGHRPAEPRLDQSDASKRCRT